MLLDNSVTRVVLMVMRTVRAGGSVMHAAQACRAHPAPCCMCRPSLWVMTKKHPITTPPLEIMSRHKVFYRDKNFPPLGKLFRDIMTSLSRPKPSPTLNSVVTVNFCRYTRPKNLCRNRESLCHDPNHPASLGTVLQHRVLITT